MEGELQSTLDRIEARFCVSTVFPLAPRFANFDRSLCPCNVLEQRHIAHMSLWHHILPPLLRFQVLTGTFKFRQTLVSSFPPSNTLLFWALQLMTCTALFTISLFNLSNYLSAKEQRKVEHSAQIRLVRPFSFLALSLDSSRISNDSLDFSDASVAKKRQEGAYEAPNVPFSKPFR